MKVLIVRKFTNLELHGQRLRKALRHSLLNRRNLVHLQTAHDEHYRCLDVLRANLEKAGIDYKEIGRDGSWPKNYRFDLVMTVGGDGTLLSASHKLEARARMVGIRSSRASVGFLCAGDRRTIPQIVKKLLTNKLAFNEVSRIQAQVRRVHGQGKTLVSDPVLNDILFANSNPAATTRYRIFFGGKHEVHKSSGVWIATAIGSSAGIFAAGGKPLSVTDRRAQFRVRELYDDGLVAYRLTNKIFDPSKQSLRIENRSEKAILALDGQHGSITLHYGDLVTIKRAPSLLLAKSDRL